MVGLNEQVTRLETQLEFFNTHPFLACAVLGCAVRLEAEGEAEPEVITKGKAEETEGESESKDQE